MGKPNKKNTFVAENSACPKKDVKIEPFLIKECKRRDARVVEEARLESVYTPKAYRGFESPSLRIDRDKKERKLTIIITNYQILKI